MRPRTAAAALLLLAWSAPAGAQQEPGVAVVAQSVGGDFVNLTVASLTGPGEVRGAGLYVEGALASSQAGSVWVYPNWPAQLSFRMKAAARVVDLRFSFAVRDGEAESVSAQAIRLSLQGAADVRPIRTAVEGENATVVLQNLGNATARDLLLSLQDEGGAAIADPFYARLARLEGGATAAATFRLAAAAARAFLVVEGPYERTRFPVLLTPSGSGAALTLQADSPSVQGVPGGSVEFRLTLTNRGAERVVELATPGLPPTFTSAFSAQGSRVHTLRMGPGESRPVTLTIGLPALAGQGLDRVAFTAQAEGGGGRAQAALAIAVAGQPRLELSGRTWHVSTTTGEAEVEVVVKNPGTGPAHDVAVAARAPQGWEVQATPPRIPRIDPGGEATVSLRLAAPAGTGEGLHVLDVGAQGGGATARERSLTVELDRPAPSPVPWLLGAAALGTGITILLLRMKRR